MPLGDIPWVKGGESEVQISTLKTFWAAKFFLKSIEVKILLLGCKVISEKHRGRNTSHLMPLP